ncbi:MAG: CheR family methyltransferase [bacterium]|jgi:chemotaxis protein methyltransferase CheR
MAISPLSKVSFSDKEFLDIAARVEREAGITLKLSKKDMMYARLVKRLKVLNLETFNDYVMLLSSRKGEQEMAFLINSMTTNHTLFFREEHHFEHMIETVCPVKRGLSIWSCGCSSGQEPYSLALSLAANNTENAARSIRILATDLDSNVIAHGMKGQYSLDSKPQIPDVYFEKGLIRKNSTCLEMAPLIKAMVRFDQLNIIKPWTLRDKFDIIFCRNMLIYFDHELQAKIISQFCDVLHMGGYLYLGHSESVRNKNLPLKMIGRTIYQKVAS